jgi:peptidoglycan/xylan/chitin deacetylase (PgdA/CDA1 family)
VTLVHPDVTVAAGAGPDAIAARALAAARPGAVVLLHESRAVAEALPRVLDALARRGYIFVTVADLGR